MIAQYQDLSANQGKKGIFAVPDDITESRLIQGYLMEIENLSLQLRKN